MQIGEIESFIFSVVVKVTSYVLIGVGVYITWSFIWFELITKIVFNYLKLYKAWVDFIWHRNRIKKWLKEGDIKVWNLPFYKDEETAIECGCVSGSLYRSKINGKQQICIVP